MIKFRSKKKTSKNSYYFLAGLILTLIMLSLILMGIVWTPFNPDTMDGANILGRPTIVNLFGTDHLGRDIFSRVLTGGGNTLIIALGTILIGGSVGILVGAITGYFGGWLDEVLMRINDVVATFPSVLLALVIISILGPGRNRVILALGIAFIPSFARVVRGEFMRYREADFVISAKLMKIPSLRIMLVHILPNILPVLLSAIAIGFNNAVLAEAGMSYLGIGVQPPDASLGRMLSESQSFLIGAPWYAIFPGFFIIILVLGVGLLGEGILDKYGGGR
jgi:peptide/nickel transport system permease protein